MRNIVVKKFGGTSVSNPQRIKHVANLIARTFNSDIACVVIVSAMAGVTDDLVCYANEISAISTQHELREYDTIIASGEQITTGLLSLALISFGIKAKSYLGWQLPIATNDDHSKAKILQVETRKILQDIDNNIIPIVAGFQGICNDRITTLGRGGSDTTAVAVAAALNAIRCDIHTDVDGIFTTDPRIVPKARKIENIRYDEMLEMASAGAKVIHPRAIEIAMHYNIPIRVLNTFSNNMGTIITQKPHSMERINITGIVNKNNLVVITIKKVSIDNINHIIDELLKVGVIMESVAQESLSCAETNVFYNYTITVSVEYEDRIIKILEKMPMEVRDNNGINIDVLQIKRNLSRITVIGIGIKNDCSVVNAILHTLQEVGTFANVLSTLETQISFLVDQVWTDHIMRNLHTKFGLDV